MRIQTILNQVEKFKSFTYGTARLEKDPDDLAIVVQMKPRKNGRAYCSGCGRSGPVYDRLEERRFEFVPLWGILVFFAASSAESVGGKNARLPALPRRFGGFRSQRRPSFVAPGIEGRNAGPRVPRSSVAPPAEPELSPQNPLERRQSGRIEMLHHLHHRDGLSPHSGNRSSSGCRVASTSYPRGSKSARRNRSPPLTGSTSSRASRGIGVATSSDRSLHRP